jgi:hypothetical protein
VSGCHVASKSVQSSPISRRAIPAEVMILGLCKKSAVLRSPTGLVGIPGRGPNRRAGRGVGRGSWRVRRVRLTCVLPLVRFARNLLGMSRSGRNPAVRETKHYYRHDQKNSLYLHDYFTSLLGISYSVLVSQPGPSNPSFGSFGSFGFGFLRHL